MSEIPRILLTGWDQIADGMGVTPGTAKKWAKLYGLPIIVFGKTPTLCPAVFEHWCAEVIKIGIEEDKKEKDK